jgi:DnaJ-class molecular chaperone
MRNKNIQHYIKTCHRCGGLGISVADGNTCERCGGLGKVKAAVIYNRSFSALFHNSTVSMLDLKTAGYDVRRSSRGISVYRNCLHVGEFKNFFRIKGGNENA